MGVPKRKRSRQRRDKRFANKGLDINIVMGCQTCQAPLLPHRVCNSCGYYKGVKILRTKTDRVHARADAATARSEAAKAHAAKSPDAASNPA